MEAAAVGAFVRAVCAELAVAAWPRLPARGVALVDALLSAGSEEAALEALAPALSQPARATAARLLSLRFLAPASAGLPLLAAAMAGEGAARAARAAAAASLLLSLPERAVDSGQPLPPPLAPAPLFHAALAQRALEAAAAAPAADAFCALLWARSARRGGAAQVAAAALAAPPAAAAAAAAARLAQRLWESDRHAAERFGAEAVAQLAADPGGGGAAARAARLRSLLGTGERYAALLAERLLLRAPPPPRRVLTLLLRACLDGGGAAPPATADALAARFTTALLDGWCDPALAAAGGPLQLALSGALCAALRPDSPAGLPRLQRLHPQLLPRLLQAVSARLGSPLPDARRCGMAVAHALSSALRAQTGPDSTLPLLFADEAAEAGAGDEWAAGDLWEMPETDAEGAAEAAAEAEALRSAAMRPPPPAAAALDPDAPFSPAAGGWRRAAEAADGGGSDSELSPYELSDAEEGGGEQAPLPPPPPPDGLRGLLEALRGGDAGAGAAGAAAQQAALRAAEPLIRAGGAELSLFAGPLAAALLHAHAAEVYCAEDGDGGGGRLRLPALVALLSLATQPAAETLLALFAGAQLDLGTRLEVLDALSGCAAELSGREAAAPPEPPAAAAAAAAPGRGRTRLIAPRALALRRRGPPAARPNRFGAAQRHLGPPLLACLAAALAPPARGAADPAAGLLLGRLLVTLGCVCAACARTPAAQLAPPQLLILLARAAAAGAPPAAHPEPYVRRCAHYAAAAAARALPPAALAAAAEAEDELCAALEALAAIAEGAAAAEPDEQARELAAAFLQARAAVAEEAGRVAGSLPTAELGGGLLSVRMPSLSLRGLGGGAALC